MGLATLAALLLASPVSAQGIQVETGGYIESDIRYRIESVSVGGWYDERTLDAGFSRNQNTFKGRMAARMGKARGVADVDFVLLGFPDQLEGFSDLSDRAAVDPYRFEAHSLYVDIRDVGLKGLDLRVGQQLVQWGVGDQFNPTNNLNADDLEDPLRFGDQLANIMLRADYTPIPFWSLSAVLVPIFKPAILPASAELGLAAVDRVPVLDDAVRRRLIAEQSSSALGLLGYPTIVDGVSTQLPQSNAKNMQWSVRLAGVLANQDLALSYYRGRTDFPVPVANHTHQEIYEESACNPSDEEDCIKGLLLTDLTLAYPKMQVWGLNASGEFDAFGWITPKIHPIGYRMELAWIHPERQDITLTNDEIDFGIIKQEAGEYDYGLGEGVRPAVVMDKPFFKWTVGLDYSIGRHIYLNLQWVHGLPDEYGAGDWITEGWQTRSAGVTSDDGGTLACALAKDGTACTSEIRQYRLGDYFVPGIDLTFGHTALRLFGLFALNPTVSESWSADKEARVSQTYKWSSKEGRSIVFYPELRHNFGNGLELSAGALLLFGENYTKFGDPAAGGSQVFARAHFGF